MPVIKTTIQAAIKSMLEELKDGDPEETIDNFADELSTVITDAILSATITVPAAIPVQVVPATGTGATTAPAIATIA